MRRPRPIPHWISGKPLTPGRAVRIIVVTTVVITVAGGIAIRIIDSDEFGDIGTSLWWALQTVTIVGYGDVVPRDAAGRVVGAVLMLQGVGFITIVVAAVTATLIAQMRERAGRGPETDVTARLKRIEEKLEALERGRG